MGPTNDIIPTSEVNKLLNDIWLYELIDELNWEGAKLIRHGLQILSINGKTPCNRTGNGRRQWKKTKCNEKNLRRGLQGVADPYPAQIWSREDKELIIVSSEVASQPGLGILMGPGSCFDSEYDSKPEKQALDYLFRDCVKKPTPTYKSKRGIHELWKFDDRLAVIKADVYEFSTPDGKTVKIRLGCNKGAHSVIPPSPGRIWLPYLSFDDLEYKFASPPELVVHRLLEHYKEHYKDHINILTSTIETSKVIELNPTSTASTPLSPTPSKVTLEKCYEATVPRRVSKRKEGIFKFARWLRPLEQYRNLDPSTPEGGQVLYPLVVKWFNRAKKLSRIKKFVIKGTLEETWQNFCDGWHDIKYPKNKERLRIMYQQSLKEVTPGSVISMVSHCQSPSLPRLIGLCALLQRLNGIESFPLDGWAVADVMEVGKSTVYRNIDRLIDNKILERTREANHDDGIAAEYIYLPAFERQELSAA